MNTKNLVLGIGIVIVFALVLWQGIEAFYPSPQWNQFCNETGPMVVPVKLGEVNQMTNASYCAEINGTFRQGYCDIYYECQKTFDNADKEHSKVVFVVSLIAALIAVILGYAVLSVEPVGSSLIASGVWSLLWGTAMNWTNFTNIWRFLLLLVALVVLIWIALRLNSKKVRKKN